MNVIQKVSVVAYSLCLAIIVSIVGIGSATALTPDQWVYPPAMEPVPSANQPAADYVPGGGPSPLNTQGLGVPTGAYGAQPSPAASSTAAVTTTVTAPTTSLPAKADTMTKATTPSRGTTNRNTSTTPATPAADNQNSANTSSTPTIPITTASLSSLPQPNTVTGQSVGYRSPTMMPWLYAGCAVLASLVLYVAVKLIIRKTRLQTITNFDQ